MKSTIFWDMMPCSSLSFNDVSEEHIASIFRVEEISSAKTSKQAGGKQNNPPAGKPVYIGNRR
jgi:hypothetical protein